LQNLNKARAAILGVLKGVPGSTSPGSTLPGSSLVLGRECLRRAGELVARELVHRRICKCISVRVSIYFLEGRSIARKDLRACS